MMIRQLIPLIFLLCLPNLLAAQQNKPIVEFYTTTVRGNPGDTICLPVKVREFRQVLGVGLGLRWNPEALEFIEVRTEGYAISGNVQTNFGLTNVANGDIKWTWLSADFPITTTVPNESTLFELCFVLKESGAGGFYSLSFDSGFVTPEVILDDNIYADPLAQANYIPGGIFISDDSNTVTLLPEFQFELACGSYISYIYTLPQGGQPPYRYSWDGPQSFFSNAQAIKAPRAGLYQLMVVDQSGDTARAEIRVDFMNNEAGLEKPEVSSAVTNPDCGVANGAITITVDDPAAYDYFWNTGDTTKDLNNIPAGNYTLIVSAKANICTDTLDFTLSSQGDIVANIVQDTIDCRGDTATIGVQVLAGLFSYSWNTGDTTNLLATTNPGDYSLTLTDGSCEQVLNFTIVDESNPPNPNNFITEDGNLACDDTTATIGVTYFGLRPDLQYRWSTGAITDKIEVSEAGSYTLEVFGEDGCLITFPFVVSREAANLPFEQEMNFLGCQSGKTRLSMIPLDGRQYTFIWNTAETTASIEIDQPGTYSITATETFSGCTQVFVFDEEAIGDPTQGAINIVVDCGTEGECYNGTQIAIQVEGAADPVQYTWNNGITITGSATDTLEIYSLQDLDLYIMDADGCTDTIRNLLVDCQLDLTTLDLKVRQYVVCETDPETSEKVTYVYNEVLNTAGVPPYTFFWGNGFVDTSYFRSRQPLDSLPNLFISVTDQIGNRFDRQLSEPPASYACGDDNTPVFSAPDTIVAPGIAFDYPLHIRNHQGVERVVYTIDWDPCLVTVDSISFYDANGLALVQSNIFAGTYEAVFLREGGSISGDPFQVVELHCRANVGVEGSSPFLFSINEAATDGADSTVLVRPEHGTIVVAEGTNLIQPGDANLNGQINHNDLLNLGLAYQIGGPDRRTQQISRRDYGYSWLNQTPQTRVDFKHLDFNGDGLINEQDLMAIDQNFTYVPEGISPSGDLPLVFAADTLYIGQQASFPVLLGTESTPADDIYGLAFSLRYDPGVIDESSVSIDFSNSWLTQGTTPLTYFRVDTENQMIHFALSRTDLQNVSGSGAVAQVIFDVISEDTLNTTFHALDATLIAANETLIPVMTGNTEAVVQITTHTRQIQQLSQQVKVFPNPVQDRLYLTATELELQAYRLYDAQGRQIQQGPITQPVLRLNGLPKGIYLLQLQTDQGLVRKRLMLQGD